MDPGEALLAVVGFEKVWKPGETRFTATHRQRAKLLPYTVLSKMRAWLGGRGEKHRPLPEMDWEETVDLLSDVPTAGELAARIDGTPGDVDLAGATLRAQQALLGIFQGRHLVRLAGVQTVPPGTTGTMRARRAWACANDFLGTVFGDLGAAMFTSAQAADLRAIFPSIYEYMARQAFGYIVEKKAEDEDWNLPRRTERQLMTFLQIPVLTPDTLAELQRTYSLPDEQPTRRAGPTGEIDLAEKVATPTQRIANR